jgi:hypothetical protein
MSIFVFLFTYTALSKIIQHKLFLVTLNQSPLLNAKAGIISWALPAVELATAMLLVYRKTQRIGMSVALALMLVFTAYIFYLLLFASSLPCSCGGVLQSLSWQQHLLLNLLLTLLALFEILLFNTPNYKNSMVTG